jgi:hypothetical protein
MGPTPALTRVTALIESAQFCSLKVLTWEDDLEIHALHK